MKEIIALTAEAKILQELFWPFGKTDDLKTFVEVGLPVSKKNLLCKPEKQKTRYRQKYLVPYHPLSLLSHPMVGVAIVEALLIQNHIPLNPNRFAEEMLISDFAFSAFLSFRRRGLDETVESIDCELDIYCNKINGDERLLLEI